MGRLRAVGVIAINRKNSGGSNLTEIANTPYILEQLLFIPGHIPTPHPQPKTREFLQYEMREAM